MPRPNMLNKILLKLCVGVTIFYLSVCLKKCLNTVRVSSWPQTNTHIIVEEDQIEVSIIFNDHVVENHTTCHYFVKSFLIPKSSRTTTLLENSLLVAHCIWSLIAHL